MWQPSKDYGVQLQAKQQGHMVELWSLKTKRMKKLGFGVALILKFKAVLVAVAIRGEFLDRNPTSVMCT